MKKILFFTAAAIILTTTLFAEQPHSPKWTFKSPFERKEFIENLGQYSIKEKSIDAKDIVFGTRQDGLRYFFTKDGMWIMNYRPVKRTEKEIERAMKEAGVKETAEEGKQEKEWMWKFVPEFHQMQFIGANPNVEVYGVNEQSAVHNFYVGKPVVAHSWKKLIYKNLYPGIDMELIFPEDKTGFKYSFMVHPGADPSVIKIKYPENKSVILSTFGDIQIKSQLGDFTDHAPIANESQTAKAIDCAFTLNKDIVGFSVGKYDASQGLVIDPWTSTPVFTGSNNAFDVDWDNGGNCYVYGGTAPFQVLKFSPAGSLIWSYTTTFSAAWYYGDFAVDHKSGASYITDGFNSSGAQTIKINTTGAQIAIFNGNSLFQEMWRIAFSRCTNQAVIAGGGTSSPSYTGCYLDTNLSAMFPVNVINSPTGLHDMWGIALDAFGSAYFITAKTQVGSAGYDNIIYKVPTPALTPITWQTPEGYNFVEVASVNYAPGPPNGFNGTTISNSNLYTYDSYVLKKWSTASGANLATVNVNGTSASTMTYGGLTSDDCDNLFLGVNNTIRQYSSSLTQVGTIAAPNNVYDCQLGINNTLFSCGMGFVMATQVNLLPCSILNVTDAITTGGCATPGSATVTVTGGTAPYTVTWNSSPPITGNVLSGVPSGTYIATITDNSCIKQTTYDTVIIQSGGSAALTVTSGSVCPGGSFTITASGATSYTWTSSSSLAGNMNDSVVVASPSATTSYTVNGSVPGCTGTAVSTITVAPSPTITANAASICLGQQTATITATGASTYTWSPSTGLNATNTASVTAQPPSTQVYVIAGTSTAGCISMGSTTVTVNALPVVTATSTPACLGTTLTMSTSVGTSWAWSGPNSFTSTVQAPSISNVTNSAAGTYTLVATDANGCFNNTILNVGVYPLPVPTASSNSPLCVNQNLNLTGGGGVNYAWQGPNSYTAAVQNPTISGITTNGAGVYTVTVTDANSCVAATTVSVTVNPLPTVTVGGATVCANNTFTLNATGGVGYSWNGPSAFSSNLQNPVLTNANSTMNGAYVVTVTDANGCVNANIAQVVVNSLPVITVNSGAVCLGQSSATLTATGADSYAWSPSQGLSSNNGATVIANPSAQTVYTVVGTDLNGCQSQDTSLVTVNPVPVLATSPAVASGCAPLCVSFTYTSSTTGLCSWNLGDGNTSGSCTPSHCYWGQGTFSSVLTLTDNNGCVGTATTSVLVYPVPDANFNPTPQPTSILDPQIHFNDATTGANVTSWTWTFGDPLNSGANVQNPVFTYTAVGSYDVMLYVVSDHGCKDSIIKIVKIDDEFMLYVPNAFSPNGDFVNDVFMAKGEGIKDFKMYIYDRWGNLTCVVDDIEKGWDGRFMNKGSDIVQEDVYVWKIELKNFKGEKRQFSGIVNLLK